MGWDVQHHTDWGKVEFWAGEEAGGTSHGSEETANLDVTLKNLDFILQVVGGHQQMD